MPFRDDGVDIEITADDRKARPAIERTNTSLQRIEKTAQAMGAAIANAMRVSWDAFQRTTARINEGVTAMLAYKKATAETAVAILATAGAGHQFVNGFRAVRLALSPTILTGFTIGLGIMAQKIYEVTRARYELIRAEAMGAAQAGMSYRRYATFGSTERLLGAGAGTLTTALKDYSPLRAREISAELTAITDPALKAQKAVEYFGESAEKVLPLLGERFDRAVLSAHDLSGALDTRVRQSLAELGTALYAPVARLKAMGDYFTYLAELARNKITITVATIYEEDKRHVRQSPISRGLAARGAAAGGFALTYNERTGRLEQRVPDIPSFAETEQQMGLGYPRQPGVPSGNIFGGLAARASYMASKEGLQARLGELAGRRSALVQNFEYGPAVAASALVPIDREMRVIEARIKAIEKQEENLRKEEALAEKLKESSKELAEVIGWSTLSSMSRSTIFGLNGRTITSPNPNYRGAPFAYTAEEQDRLIARGMAGANIGMPSRGAPFGRFDEARYDANLKATERFQERQLQYEIKRAQLSTAPGGELATAERVYALRVAAAKERQDWDAVTEAAWDRENDLLDIQKRKFDEIRLSFEGLFDSMLGGARSFWEAVKRMALTLFLTPIKQAMSNWFASIMTGRGGASAGAGGGLAGVLGSFGNMFSGGGAGLGTPAYAQRFSGGAGGFGGSGGLMGSFANAYGHGGVSAGSQGLTPVPGMIGVGMTWDGVLAPMTTSSWRAGLTSASRGFATMGGMSLTGSGMHRGGTSGNLMTVAGGAAMGYGAAGMMGMTGYGGAIAGAGAGLAMAGLQRGGWSGLGMSAAGGALVGMQFGGPIGAAIGGIVGGVAGLFRMLWESSEDKVIKKVQQLYDLKINKSLAKQIVEMAKQNYGGNLDMAIRSPQIREMLELYSMATGQGMKGLAVKQMPTTFSQSGGRMVQQPNYWNGMVYSPPVQTTGLANSTPEITVVVHNSLPPNQVGAYMEGKVVTTISKVPRVIEQASLDSRRSSYGRKETAAQILQPSLVLM